MKSAIGFGLGLSLLVAVPAIAQSPSEVAMEQARMHGGDLYPSSAGWQVDRGPIVSSLDQGASETLEIRLRAGERYAIIAGCDRDCSDMDSEITDRSGNTRADDYLMNDYPALEFTTDYSGAYSMRVSMPSCSMNPCYYAYIVYRMEGGGGGGGSSADQARADLDRHVADFFPSDRGWRPVGDTETRSLSEGSSETVRLTLDAGVEYGVLATCDRNCSDIDSEIRDQAGNTLADDYLPDDYPVLEFRTVSSGSHTLEISMHSCSASPCVYAYQVYRKEGGEGGDGGAPADRTTPHARQAQRELAEHVPDFFPRSEGWAITGEAVVRTLPDGSSEDLTVTLSGGVTYGIIATCDDDCDDLDLHVYDDAGGELDSDTAPDDYPILRFQTPYSGTYRLEVTMYECSVEPCYYAYEVYRR